MKRIITDDFSQDELHSSEKILNNDFFEPKDKSKESAELPPLWFLHPGDFANQHHSF